MQLKDIPKVTRCLALMAKMVGYSQLHLERSRLQRDALQAGVKEFENVTIELPEEEDREDRDLPINDDVMQSVSV